MAPAPSLSRWQSRPTGSPLAQLQGVSVTSHWLPAYLHPTTHPPTCLRAYVLPPSPSAFLIRKGWEREDNGPSIALSLTYKSNGCSLLKEKCSLSFSLNLFPALYHASVSLSPVSRLSSCHEKTVLCGFFCTCVSDQKREDESGGEGRCPGLVFGFRLPTVFPSPPPPPFLHSSLLLLLLSQGRQLNKEVWVCYPFFSLRLSLIKSVALGRFFLFVSVWRAEDTGTQNTWTSFLALPPKLPLPPPPFSS